MPHFHHRLPFGAELQSRAETRFRLWAPDANAVALELPNGSQRYPLRAIDDGWFETTVALGAGTRYFYRIDDELNVPDPAARFAPEGVQGPSEVIDPRAFEWHRSTWEGLPWHQAVLYELHVGTFTNEGTYAAIIPRLRELADVGINTLELLPIATFPGKRGWGYDGVLPFAPHPEYGTPDDLKRFIQAAHDSGIAVVLDVVYNHFGPEGNYLHRYANGFFTDRYQTPWGSAIDFESAAGRNVRQVFIQNALYWLEEYRFDGLRLDAVHAIRDASTPHFVDELAAAIEAGPARERHVHLILENHHNEASRLQRRPTSRLSKAQWNDDFHHVAHVVLTGERDGYYANYADRSNERLGRVLAEGFAYQGEPYGESGEPRGERSVGLPPSAFIDFLQNHDQIGNRALGERLVGLTSHDKLRAGVAWLLLSPHIPMLFMGEEYAATQPFLYFCDYQGELAEAITIGRRAEFGEFAAFATMSGHEGIPDPNACETFERSRLQWQERERSPHREWLAYIRELLHVRAQHVAPRIPAIAPGSARYEVRGAHVCVQWPVGTREVLQLDANLGDPPCHLAGTPLEIIYSTAQSNAVRELPPWGVRLSLVTGDGR